MNKSKHYTLTLRLAEQSGNPNRFQGGAMELVTSSYIGSLLQHKDGSCCCGGSGSYDAQRPVLSAPVALATVGAAAGGVLAVDGPAILVTALQPVVDNLRKSEKLSSALRIRGGPVGSCSRIQLNPEHSN